jgi:hypothetical protein
MKRQLQDEDELVARAIGRCYGKTGIIASAALSRLHANKKARDPCGPLLGELI